MVGILSLNPCVDKTMFFESIPKSGVYITDKTFTQPGGKGTNVARVLKNLNVDVKLFTILAGETGEQIKNLLKKEQIDAEYIFVNGMSRMYITLLDKEYNQIALKENGPEITESEIDVLKEKFIKYLDNINFLCLSDSIPCKSLTPFYSWAILQAKQKNIPVLLDADGEALKLSIKQLPNIIKPNIDEYAELLGKSSDKIEIKQEIINLYKSGILHPVISLGENGAATICDGKVVRFYSQNTAYINPVGCGDSFIAGLIYGYTNNLPWQECMIWATASGAANCEKWEAARLCFKEIENKLKTVVKKEL